MAVKSTAITASTIPIERGDPLSRPIGASFGRAASDDPAHFPSGRTSSAGRPFGPGRKKRKRFRGGHDADRCPGRARHRPVDHRRRSPPRPAVTRRADAPSEKSAYLTKPGLRRRAGTRGSHFGCRPAGRANGGGAGTRAFATGARVSRSVEHIRETQPNRPTRHAEPEARRDGISQTISRTIKRRNVRACQDNDRRRVRPQCRVPAPSGRDS
jgi:hypothetical protein